ncbi:hypothetical protein GOD90_10710 [Sinorhizobium medicae]|nr:hypothetical protein [Sinorhizobium medicae]
MDERRRSGADEAQQNQPRIVAEATSGGDKDTYWIFAYVLVGFLTFGMTYNATAPQCAYRYCHFDRALGSVVKGTFWPVYFTGKAAIAITKPVAEVIR